MKTALLMCICASVCFACKRSEPAPGTVGFDPQSAQWIARDGKAASDTAFRKAARGFGAALYLTTDGGFFERWNAPAIGAAYDLKPLGEVQRNRFFYTVVIRDEETVRLIGTRWATKREAELYRRHVQRGAL